MTVEEAKKFAKLECALEFCKKQSVLEQYVSDEKWKHFDVAVNAIEKQIPQKPIKRNGLVRTGRGYELLDEKEQEYCSKCNRLVQPPCEKYCSYCGQAIYFE